MSLLTESMREVFVSGKVLQNENTLNIAYGIDQNFLFGAAVSMQSVAMHNPNLSLCFHIFTDYIDNDYLKRVKSFTGVHENVEVHIYQISGNFIELLPSLKQWSYATFFRLLAFQYLSDYIDNVLYLDADVICKGKLNELCAFKFGDGKFAAVIKDVPFMQKKPAERLGIDGLPGNYFNAGVVLLKLEAWKHNDFMNKALDMLASDPEHIKYKCLDQDILNVLFFGSCIFISHNYDCFYGIDYELNNKHRDDYKKTITAETKLIHYVGITKPWNDWTDYPCQKYFNEAYEKSCWYDVPLIQANNEKQFYVKYKHANKQYNIFIAFKYYIKFKLAKYRRKIITLLS